MNNFCLEEPIIHNEMMTLTMANVLEFYAFLFDVKLIFKTQLDHHKWEAYCDHISKHGLPCPKTKNSVVYIGDMVLKDFERNFIVVQQKLRASL